MLKDFISDNIINAIKQAAENNELGDLKPENVQGLSVEKPKNPEFGDFAINVSPLARFAKMPPPKIAEIVKSKINIEDAEISVVAGFINIKLGNRYLNGILSSIISAGADYGKNNIGENEKVLLEYVSANPTGPLHIGHGRWAAVGSSLANLMKFCGYDVAQEFYINDAGNQINNLGRSLWVRILQESGKDVNFPADPEEAKKYYPGEYLIEVAQEYIKLHPQKIIEFESSNSDPLNPSEELIKEMSDFAKERMLDIQKVLLANFRTGFDSWYSETALHQSGEVEATIEKLKNLDKLYEKEGALWFKSSEYGDDQDRVIIKNDGSYTYLTADIAYHYDKIKRGYDRLVNIWGADHHGYVARMKASIDAMGKDSSCLEVLLGQLVNLIISGEQVRMGKRKKMLTLEDLINEVGVDGTRYWMIMRSIDTTLDFDVDLAKSKSDENPVFYVQYAHARACSILRTATSERFDQQTKESYPPVILESELENVFSSVDADLLENLWKSDDTKEIESTKSLLLKLESFEDLINTAVSNRAPYMIARYLQELAKDFHHFYTFTRVLSQDAEVMKSRLCLVKAVKQVVENALGILGVSAPESM